MQQYDGIALFSGGLDSLLTARLLMEQGLAIKCLHFHSPFFGSPGRVEHWRSAYGLDIDAVDAGPEYVEMLKAGPAHGFGSAMNPCVDCKILMMRRAKDLMQGYGASFIASGEVLGQRPMSQRRDTLNIILRDAGVRGLLLRPLCALLLEPTQAELSGLVDRSRLLAFNGRGRKDQLELAHRFGISEIPTPGGGCKLTEKENTRRFWPVLRRVASPSVEDFRLADIGRQFWHGDCWLSIGRHQQDNEAYAGVLRPATCFSRSRASPVRLRWAGRAGIGLPKMCVKPPLWWPPILPRPAVLRRRAFPFRSTPQRTGSPSALKSFLRARPASASRRGKRHVKNCMPCASPEKAAATDAAHENHHNLRTEAPSCPNNNPALQSTCARYCFLPCTTWRASLPLNTWKNFPSA